MPVFISHKKADRTEAITIGAYLRENGVQCYIDEFDPILKTTDDITNTIMSRVRACSHLMAVVSENTNNSWWVPFEIGVASETEKRITSYKLRAVTLPEYLEKWPIMKTKQHLDLFIQMYKSDSQTALNERSGYSATISSAESFHRQLKASIR